MNYADLEDRVKTEIREHLVENGINPDDIEESAISIRNEGEKIVFSYAGALIEMPAPSQEAIDAWWKTAGNVIVGAFVAVVCVGIGVKLAAND